MDRQRTLLNGGILVVVGLAGAGCFPELGAYASGGVGGTGGGGAGQGGSGLGGAGGSVGAGLGGAGGSGGGTGGTGGLAGAGGGLGDATCADLTHNGSESGLDCGGDACAPCPIGQPCSADSDCVSGNCDATCQAAVAPICPLAPDPDGPTCADCAKNGLETDIDCGGDSCAPCEFGLVCDNDADCTTGACVASKCVRPNQVCPGMPDLRNPTCSDCAQNGTETAEDCGGDTCGPCADGSGCQVDADCESGNCDGNLCILAFGCPVMPDPENPTCADCALNGGETGKDCGGDACAPCAAGLGCAVDSDCASGSCVSGTCA